MNEYRTVEVINKDSDKPPYVVITIDEAKQHRNTWLGYYRIQHWWKEIEEQLSKNRTLITAYGRRRVFFQQWGEELFKAATAHEPQSVVADHFNGRVHPELGIRGGLIEIHRQIAKPSNGEIKILNQSHDSCILEVPKNNAHDILGHMKHLLRRPLVVRGHEFTIPVDGEIGERWGEMEAA
jgi:DNA polymerase I-like protein with 3'-5' exonuclease and polymerase domains